MTPTALSTPPDIRAGKDPRWPAGPTLLSRVLSGRVFQQPVDFMVEMAREHGDLVHYRAAGRHVFQFNHPELVGDLLVRDAKHHLRGIVMQRSKMVLGEGLLTSEDPLHIRQRRLAQPAFHRDRIAAYGRIIGQFASESTAEWQTGTIRQVHTDMQTLALRIVGKTLFDQELGGDTEKIASAIDAFMGFLPLVFLPFSETLQKLPIPLVLRIKRSRAELDEVIYRIIAERRAQGAAADGVPAQCVDRGDLLSMLLASVDTVDNTGGMSDSQVRDECVTTMLAGNETTANALSFALWLLASHPDQQERLHAEAAAVLGDRTASAENYPNLRYTWMCFAEAMRLYPPVWVTARTAAEDYHYRGFTIPKDSLLLAPQFFVHRDPRFWEEPATFEPSRFAAESGARPKMSYFPFAAGSRQCIGEGLAWMEGVLSLASIVRDWRLRLPLGASRKIEALGRISMRPKGEVPLLVERR